MDVGSETGTVWPLGNIFDVSISFNSWTGSLKGSVTGTYTNVGDIQMILSDFSINAYVKNNSLLINSNIDFQSTITGDDTPYIFSWYIDNEKVIYNQNITYQFEEKEDYKIELVVRDSCRNELRDSLSLNVEENPNSTNTPGFETILLLSILGFFVIYNKRKKK
jgi:hypothetical protein